MRTLLRQTMIDTQFLQPAQRAAAAVAASTAPIATPSIMAAHKTDEKEHSTSDKEE